MSEAGTCIDVAFKSCGPCMSMPRSLTRGDRTWNFQEPQAISCRHGGAHILQAESVRSYGGLVWICYFARCYASCETGSLRLCSVDSCRFQSCHDRCIAGYGRSKTARSKTRVVPRATSFSNAGLTVADKVLVGKHGQCAARVTCRVMAGCGECS